MSDQSSFIIVAGTSAGGLTALVNLFSQLQADFPVPVLVVQHTSADATGQVLLDALNENTHLKCVHATNGEQPQPGHLYLAPSDHHLMLDEQGAILVTKGARENRSRPAIDPLFRSAAVAFGNRTIGILLTGYLDDGTAGMKVIKRCGGTCIVQDPKDAEYPAMPENALKQVKVQHSLPVVEMGGLLYKLISRKPGKQKAIPKDILTEARIAQRVLSDLPAVESIGKQAPYNCPGCGGVLWQIDDGPSLRFRCHTGHAYTASSLLAEQNKQIEETMWTALRMFEERRNLLSTMSEGQSGTVLKTSLERISTYDVHIDRIRAILKGDVIDTKEDFPM